MLGKLFKRKDSEPEAPAVQAPEIMGLRLGGAFEFDPLKLKLIEPGLIVEQVAKTQLIQAVGVVKLDESSTLLRYYTDDEGFLQVLLTGGMTENHIADVKMWFFYDTQSVDSQAQWDELIASGISQPEKTLEEKTFLRVWGSVGESSSPVAMTEKTTSEEGDVSEVDQFTMLYQTENDLGFEYLLIAGEEKIIDDRADRCLVTSTGFDVNPADIQIIG